MRRKAEGWNSKRAPRGYRTSEGASRAEAAKAANVPFRARGWLSWMMDTVCCASGCRSSLRKEWEHRQIPRREYGEYEDEKERHGHDRNDELHEIAAGFVPNARIADR